LTGSGHCWAFGTHAPLLAGNQYDGEWRAGVMHGFGTYTWVTGQRYDGEWKVSKWK